MMLIVVLSPLPFGSNRPWAWSATALATGTMLFYWGMGTTLKNYGLALSSQRILLVAVPFSLVLIWIGIQLVSFSPSAWHNPIWQQVNGVGGLEVSGLISINAYETATAFMRLLTYGGVFWVALNLCRAPHRAYNALLIFSLAGFLYAVYGLVVEFNDTNSILWFKKWAYENDLTSIFVNRNNYATYAGLGLVVTLGLLFHEFRLVMSDRLDARRSILFIFESLSLRLAFLIIATPTFVTALLLTHSRAGLASTIVGVTVLCIASAFTKIAHRTRSLVLSLLVAGVGGALFTLGGQAVSDRMSQLDNSIGDRMDYYQLVVDKITEFPFTGVGYGNFLAASWSIRDQNIAVFWDKAHNSYLESALELGIPAALILVLTIAIIGIVCIRGIFQRNRDEIYSAIGIAAIALVGVHSLVDFSVQIPAVAIGFSLILGVAYSQAWNSKT
tara:strand:- start:6083 stop:7414 length:1332 start_codon:yes stop_codon:yes gene_type:complete